MRYECWRNGELRHSTDDRGDALGWYAAYGDDMNDTYVWNNRTSATLKGSDE